MRLIALAAFAVLLTTPAFARNYTISLDSFCNVGVITTGGPSKTFLYKETGPQSCNNVVGTGVLVKDTVNGTAGKWLVIGEVKYEDPKSEYTMFFQYPLVTGGQFDLYATANGQTLIFLGDGTYTLSK
jgi:hypothetical protein